MSACPHCHSKAAPVACSRCTRDMCEDCISYHSTIGKVCGLCLDELTRQERGDDDNDLKHTRSGGDERVR